MGPKFRALVALLIGALVPFGCFAPDTAERPDATIITIANDSEWSVPPGFSVTLPLSYRQIAETLKNDTPTLPDFPTFTMSRGADTADGRPGELIAIFADGISEASQAEDVMSSWFNSFTGADFPGPTVQTRNDLQIASARGHAQSPTESSPQEVILTVISEPQTQRIWRLLCLRASGSMSDDAVRACNQVTDEFSPLPLPSFP